MRRISMMDIVVDFIVDKIYTRTNINDLHIFFYYLQENEAKKLWHTKYVMLRTYM